MPPSRPDWQAARPSRRVVEFVELCRPHLVLADIRSDEGLSFGYLVELLEHELRLDDLRFAVVAQAIFRAPLLDLLPPRGERGGIGPLRRRFEELDELFEHVGHVPDD